MVAWMDDAALARTLETREATYFSRSRGEQWIKGRTSGHTQHVHSVRLDCDGDTVLLEVDQVGGACHTGDHSCFDADLLLGPEASGKAVALAARRGRLRWRPPLLPLRKAMSAVAAGLEHPGDRRLLNAHE